MSRSGKGFILNNSKLRIARIATVPFFLDNQLRSQMGHLVEKGFSVTAISSIEGNWERLYETEGLDCVQIDIAREPALLKDLASLYKLYRLFREAEFDVMHSTTPKAGLLCAIASFLARTPIRMHTFTGQVWSTKKGMARWVLRLFDKCIVLLNTQCYADSESQKQFLIEQGVANNSGIKVLGEGSIAGVDLERFNKEKWLPSVIQTKKELGINDGDFVLVFIGRLSGEKGIYELMEAFSQLKIKYTHLHLILIGPCEENKISKNLIEWQKIDKLHYMGQITEPEKYLCVSNLLCLPSYREGFGTVVIEAAAMAVPTVGTDTIGLKDAIKDGESGVLVEAQNAISLANELESLIKDEDRCNQLGEKSFRRCRNNYDAKRMSDLVAKEYDLMQL